MIKHNFDLFAGSKQILKNTDLIVTFPNKYGLVGYNGSGKSTLLKFIHTNFSELDVYYVDQDLVDNTDDNIKEIILKSNKKRNEIKITIDKLNNLNELNDQDLLLYNELQDEYRQYDNDDAIVTKILYGLGFTNEQMLQPLKMFSGGWRMRVSIARGLYMKPKYLLLDEPTNHLDLEGIIYLTNYLTKWKNSLIVVSHDKYFIDNVCSNIIHINEMKLCYYNHGYSNFIKSLIQKNAELEKKYILQQKRIKELKKKNMSSDQILEKIGQLIELPAKYKVNIAFPDCGKVNSNNIITMESVSFSFGDKIIFDNIDFAIDGNTRVALVGKNGVGKSTLLKLLDNKLTPTKGVITKDSRNKIYYYDQLSTIIMDDNMTMIQYLNAIDPNLKIEDIRKLLGTIGFESNLHNQKIELLSGGQKMKLQFIPINIKKPHLLLLDEPTNNLDLESIESLIEGINNFSGGVVVITHSVDLIRGINSQVKLIQNHKLIDIDFEDYCDSLIDQ